MDEHTQKNIMNRPSSLTHILATVLIAEASVLAATMIFTDAKLSAQVSGPPAGMNINLCGNGNPESWNHEQCDDEDDNGKVGKPCTIYCQWDVNGNNGTNPTPQPVCGNTLTEGDEQCDDGNDINTDGCTEYCRLPFCSDGFVQPSNNEECDDGNTDRNDSCNECKDARCGDGYTQPSNNEDCDAGLQNGIVPTSGKYCTALCKEAVVVEEQDDDEDENDDNDEGGNSSASSRKSQSSASSVKSTPAQPEQKPVNTTNSNTVLPSVPSVPEESAETAEAKKKAEEEKKKAEEERLEEQQKILEDILERSLEDAVEEDTKKEDTVLQDGSGTTVTPKTEPVVVKQQNVIKEDDLRCTDADGNLTTDRSKCDYVKEKEIRKPVTITIPEPEIEKKIRENVLGSDIVQKRSDSLLVTLRDLRARTENIANSEEFNTEVEQYLQDVLDWLDRGIEYFSSELRSLEDINRMTGPVRQLAEQTSVLIKQQKNLPLETPDINPILTRTEALLAKFRESFIALAQGKVALPQESLQKFVEAVNLYDTVKALCLEDDDECIRINEVLEKLKDVRSPLQDALEANPEIYKAVQEKFEE